MNIKDNFSLIKEKTIICRLPIAPEFWTGKTANGFTTNPNATSDPGKLLQKTKEFYRNGINGFYRNGVNALLAWIVPVVAEVIMISEDIKNIKEGDFLHISRFALEDIIVDFEGEEEDKEGFFYFYIEPERAVNAKVKPELAKSYWQIYLGGEQAVTNISDSVMKEIMTTSELAREVDGKGISAQPQVKVTPPKAKNSGLMMV